MKLESAWRSARPGGTWSALFSGKLYGLLALGVGIGLLLAVAATSGARTLLYGLRPTDPLSLFGAAFFLAVMALAASFWPAYRATRHDPMKALRYE